MTVGGRTPLYGQLSLTRRRQGATSKSTSRSFVTIARAASFSTIASAIESPKIVTCGSGACTPAGAAEPPRSTATAAIVAANPRRARMRAILSRNSGRVRKEWARLTERTCVRYARRTHVRQGSSPPASRRLRGRGARTPLGRRREARPLRRQADGHALVDRRPALRRRPARGSLEAAAAKSSEEHDARSRPAPRAALSGGYSSPASGRPAV